MLDEVYFYDKLNSPIKDESNINEFYLISEKWVEEYQNLFNYQEIEKILKKMNVENLIHNTIENHLNFSDKDFILKTDKITEYIKSSKFEINTKNLSKNN